MSVLSSFGLSMKDVDCDRMVVGFKTTYAISAYIATNPVSSNHAHGEVCSIQHYLMNYFSDLRQVGGFSQVSSINKTYRHDINEILRKWR